MIPRSILLSDAWAKVKGHLQEDRLALRERNDCRLPADETEFLRGQIAYVSKLLALDTLSTAEPPIMATPPDY